MNIVTVSTSGIVIDKNESSEDERLEDISEQWTHFTGLSLCCILSSYFDILVKVLVWSV